MNGTTAVATAPRVPIRRRSAWELPELVRPLRLPASKHQRQRAPLPPYAADVIAWVYGRRFATGEQIARRFPRWLASERTAQRQLATLSDHGLLAHASTRGTSPHFPYVFVATGRGLQFVRRTYEQRGLRWDTVQAEENRSRGRALLSVLHELMATEFELAFELTVGRRPELPLLMSERRYHQGDQQLRFTHDGEMMAFEPDIGVLVGGASPQLSLVEIDTGTTPARRLRDKLARFHFWTVSTEGREYLEDLRRRHRLSALPHVRLLWVAMDKDSPGRDDRRVAEVVTEGLTLPKQGRERIWIVSGAKLAAHHADWPPLAAPVWLRLRHVRPWLGSYRSLTRSLGGNPSRTMKQRAFVARHLAHMPRHAILPQQTRWEPLSAPESVACLRQAA